MCFTRLLNARVASDRYTVADVEAAPLHLGDADPGAATRTASRSWHTPT